MKSRALLVVVVGWTVFGLVGPGRAQTSPAPGGVPDRGFTELFNGRDLSGWRGLGHTSPYEIAAWSPEERRRRQCEADEDMRRHWRVEDGEIVNDGQGVYLTTVKDYGDFELVLDWRMMTPGTDSGIYLRGSPQVQIWDPDSPESRGHGADKGSGALWNNNAPEGKWPLVRADRPVGQWNHFRILMVGQRVSVVFNGQKVVDHAVMENFWDRNRPLPASGPIQLQTHGGQMRFRNIRIREIPPEEANAILAAAGDEGFRPIFNGRDLEGWTGGQDSYEIVDGVLRTIAGKAGTILTGKSYGDFAVRFEFRLPPGGNNGLVIRSPLEGNGAFVGMEIQILDDGHPRYAQLKDWQAHGSIYGVVPAHRGYLRPAGTWNFQEVVARGSRVTVTLNGTTILDADVSTIDRTPDERDHPGLRNLRGHVGFMAHGDPVELRRIRLKELD